MLSMYDSTFTEQYFIFHFVQVGYVQNHFAHKVYQFVVFNIIVLI